MKQGKKLSVAKCTPEEEQRLKDEEFLNLEPAERLRINEILRKRIWGKAYNSQKLKGLKVTKSPAP
ncbi:MAG TPA: hypothetical protein VGD65_09760 [Chryseosolibacter sp.]